MVTHATTAILIESPLMPQNKAQAFGAARRAGGTRPSTDDSAAAAEREIQKLTQAIQKFQIDGQRFFAGDLPMPPDELRERIQADLRRLRSANIKGAAFNFRLGSLEARFNSHVELFGRRLRGREQAGRKASAEERKALDPVSGVVIGNQADQESAKALYNGLYSATGSQPKMDLDRFRDYLDRQSAAIRQKTGCDEIQFRIATDGGKMKLKAKPIRRG
jgi:hypothetical protein